MNNENFTPEESLRLISEVINDARTRFQENGSIYIMWGILLGMAGIGQYLLVYFEYYSISFVPYFLMPIGGVISFLYYRRKTSGKKNSISQIIGKIWFLVLVNVIILGFVFAMALGENLVPVISIIIAIGTITSGVALKERVLQVSGVCINILGCLAFFIPYDLHPLVTASIGIFFTLIPGILISRKTRIQ